MNATFFVSPHDSVPGAFGYTVTSDAGHSVRQGFVPGESGKVRMTEAEARVEAQAVVDELQSIPAAPAA